MDFISFQVLLVYITFQKKLPAAVLTKLTQHLTYLFQRIRLVIHMHTGCILLMVRVVPQSIDPHVVSATDIRSQGVADDQHVLHVVSAHLFKAVIEVLLLRFLVSGFLRPAAARRLYWVSATPFVTI